MLKFYFRIHIVDIYDILIQTISTANRKVHKMGIIIKEIKEFSAEELENLFLSVGWESGKFPNRLVSAMRNSSYVVSAWDEEILIGLANVLDDASLTAYIHYMLVNPCYQGQGTGRQLLNKIKERYDDYINILLVAYNERIGFYESCGFEKGGEETPMFIKKINL